MCGITAGITSTSDITTSLLRQLKKLEYRGYDSAGIAFISDEILTIKHTTDDIEALSTAISSKKTPHIGIAHTRWATHGEVSIDNAHPHHTDNRIAIVHNGIIENHENLRKQLPDTITWRSQTDSEVIVHLINERLKKNDHIVQAITETAKELQGTYALAVIDKNQPNTIYCIAHESSLIIGKSKDGFFICSDQNAILDECYEACQVINDVVFALQIDKITPENTAKDLNWHPIKKVDLPTENIPSNGKVTYQEILQQEEVLYRLSKKHIATDSTICNLPEGLKEALLHCQRVLILACGSSYYCALAGKYWLEGIAQKATSVELASEFRYRNPVIEDHTLVITLSQSGETLDTISALKHLLKIKPQTKTLSIGNNTLSTLAQKSDYFWSTSAGPEIGVATTKVFTAQLFCLGCLSIVCAGNSNEAKDFTNQLNQISIWVKEVLNCKSNIKKQAAQFRNDETILFCARGPNYPIAEEAALKIKELAYMHAQGYAAGELKHGPLALIEPNLSTIFFINNDQHLNKIKSNISEVIARKGKVLMIGSQDAIQHCLMCHPAIQSIKVTQYDPPEALAPFVNVICAQLLAFFVAEEKGCAIDKPRNLAKCVTVE